MLVLSCTSGSGPSLKCQSQVQRTWEPFLHLIIEESGSEGFCDAGFCDAVDAGFCDAVDGDLSLK